MSPGDLPGSVLDIYLREMKIYVYTKVRLETFIKVLFVITKVKPLKSCQLLNNNNKIYMASLKLTETHLILPTECWDERRVPPCPVPYYREVT